MPTKTPTLTLDRSLYAIEMEGLTVMLYPIAKACRLWLNWRISKAVNRPEHIAIPGLDADKCICQYCLNLHRGGVLWVDQNMRDRLLTRRKSVAENSYVHASSLAEN